MERGVAPSVPRLSDVEQRELILRQAAVQAQQMSDLIRAQRLQQEQLVRIRLMKHRTRIQENLR
jgi:hypothetical protein